ncbi:MAG TPA: hydroxysqualene dehydroxylase HpnE [Nocardioides sp.]|uniref:hydroxysqualene dehydroxylase HpnE n=1 Tax=Nocardioides sp. TaxID=35761 RepID=UPI002E306DBC|nr:hydroxysqualene dehydroxylase HpnE [Nocardioides sp.]HEX5087645.1 hydroxysqualene dehydroxylase HpnE [Nocardioides sp.]
MAGGTVLVVGGGLAGITAALGLADAGRSVTLVEARPRLGGLTHSFRRSSRAGDLWVDNGQHVFLRCCTSYRRLLDRLGVSDLVSLQPRMDIPVRSGASPRVARLRRSALPAPLHLAGALAAYRWLPPAARVSAARAALALGSVDPDDPAVDEESFGRWLARRGQGPRAVEALWDLVGVATLNAPAERASLALAATVFQLGLLESNDAGDIGWVRVPLQRLHGDAAARALAAAGVRVELRTRVGRLPTTYDDVVVATGPAVSEDLLPGDALDLAPGWSARLGSSPIVNVHVVLDSAVLDEPFVAAVDSPLQWVFDRTAGSGLDPATGQYLALSLSAAEELLGRSVAELREWTLPELGRLLPRSRSARVLDFFVTREPQATFRAAPGSRKWRPATATRLPGLHLAGAWTDTGWPATMEGAVRSGEAAVASVLGRRTERTALGATA